MKSTAEMKKEIEGKTLSDEEKKKEMQERNTALIKEAAESVGSISADELDIRFNADIFSNAVTLVISDEERLRQKRLIVDVATFLIKEQIPLFVKECREGIDECLDTVSLIDNLHQKGVGVRYLGVIQKALKSEEDANLEHVINTVNAEMISRAIKWIFRTYLQKTDQGVTGFAVAHLLNCLFASCSVASPHLSDEINSNQNDSKKKKKKGKKADKPKPFEPNPAAIGWQRMTNEWMQVTPDSIWKDIEKRAKSYFRTNIECKSIDQACSLYNIQKASLLRDVCLKNGIQLHLRDYDLYNRNKVPFTDEDIMSMFPVVKHLNPKASDGVSIFQKGQQYVSQGYLKEGQTLIQEALQLFTSVYGNIHPDVINSYRLLARLDYIQGNHTEAIEKQHKSCLLSERCMGLDAPSTIQEYVTLAHYCFATAQVPASLKLLYRARYLLKLIHGENHPEMATIDQNIGLVLFFSAQFEFAQSFFENALKLHIQYQVKKPIKAALGHHLIARCLSFKSEFREAIEHEKETCKLYRQLFGETHDKTKESSEFLKLLTQQAVSLQKTMNAMKNKDNVKGNLPLPMQPPNHKSVLETMNVANGIYFAVSSEQREQLRRRQRAEMERQMNEIALDAGASKEQVDQAMKLARAVLNKKEDSETPDAGNESKLEEGSKEEIEEEQLD